MFFLRFQIDLSFHDLDDENLEHNLSIFQEEKDDEDEDKEEKEADDEEANQVGAKLEGRLRKVCLALLTNIPQKIMQDGQESRTTRTRNSS